MAGNLTTITVLDYAGNQKTMRVWDESGTGAGPFQFVKQTAKSDGTVVDPATSTKQPALGTAGTPSADVISVQGVVGGKQIPVDAYGTAVTGVSLLAGGLGMLGWLSQIAYYLGAIYNYSTGSVATNIATNQVSVGVAATQIIASRTTRNGVLITNEGPIDIRIGASGVTTGNGFLLPVGATITVDGGAAVYGIAASGTVAVSFMEVY